VGGLCTVTSWVNVRDGCPISFSVGGSGLAFFMVGDSDGNESFEFQFESEVLRKLLRLGTEALSEMDSLYASENPDDADGASEANTPT
jgi:hypothetical protein